MTDASGGRRTHDVAAAGFGAGAGEHLRTSFRQPMDPDRLVARVLSTSYLATLDTEVRDELAEQVRGLVDDLGDHFELPYVTYAWAFTRR